MYSSHLHVPGSMVQRFFGGFVGFSGFKKIEGENLIENLWEVLAFLDSVVALGSSVVCI